VVSSCGEHVIDSRVRQQRGEFFVVFAFLTCPLLRISILALCCPTIYYHHRKLDESLVRLPETVSKEDLKQERLLRFKFPAVNAVELRLPSASSPALILASVSVGYPCKVVDSKSSSNLRTGREGVS